MSLSNTCASFREALFGKWWVINDHLGFFSRGKDDDIFEMEIEGRFKSRI